MYLWHGTLDFVQIWSLLNFLGITLEGVAKAVSTQPAYRQLEDKMSEQAARRLHALLASPVLLMSCLSNFYFFAGTQVSPAGRNKWVFLYKNQIIFFQPCFKV